MDKNLRSLERLQDSLKLKLLQRRLGQGVYIYEYEEGRGVGSGLGGGGKSGESDDFYTYKLRKKYDLDTGITWRERRVNSGNLNIFTQKI